MEQKILLVCLNCPGKERRKRKTAREELRNRKRAREEFA